MMSLVPKGEDRIQLLAGAVKAARRANFWRPKLGDAPIRSLSDFERLPIVKADEYRRQRFSDLVANPNQIEWIPGPWLGQSPSRAAVAEGATEARIRVSVMREALSAAIPRDAKDAAAVVICSFDNRYFGAEMCAVFARVGTPAHLVSDCGASDLQRLVSDFEPSIVALLSSKLDFDQLPRSVQHIVTVGANRLPKDTAFVDLYVCNEFGVLGSRHDAGQYELARDSFYFENAPGGSLVVTPYYSRTQPIVRLDTGDKISATAAPNLC